MGIRSALLISSHLNTAVEADEALNFNHPRRSIELDRSYSPSPSLATDSDGDSINLVDYLAAEDSEIDADMVLEFDHSRRSVELGESATSTQPLVGSAGKPMPRRNDGEDTNSGTGSSGIVDLQLRCSKCEVFPQHTKSTFVSRETLLRHIQSVHEKRNFRCTYQSCLWSFTTATRLKRQLESHNYPKGHIFKQYQRLLAFLASGGKLECSQRPEELFIDLNALDRHIEWRGGRHFACTIEYCTSSFPTNAQLDQHLKFHGTNGVVARRTEEQEKFFATGGKLQCDLCPDEEFETLWKLICHQEAHGQKKFNCLIKDCTSVL